MRCTGAKVQGQSCRGAEVQGCKGARGQGGKGARAQGAGGGAEEVQMCSGAAGV
jgi:hypothetical protein